MPVTPAQKYLKDMEIGECGYTGTYLTVRNGHLVVNRYRSIYPSEIMPYSAQICRVRDGVWVDPTATYLLYSDFSGWPTRVLDFLCSVSPLRVVNEDEVRKPETEWVLE